MFNWLFRNESSFSVAEQAAWKASALRIILVSGFFLDASIGFYSSLKAIQIGAYHIALLVALLCMALCAGMYFSTRRPRFASGILLATVYAAGTSIACFVDIDDVAKLGIIFFYATPAIALLLFSTRLAVALMALNFLPFFYLLQNEPLVHFKGLNITLEGNHYYIQGLLFVLFNVWVLLAVLRDTSRVRNIEEALQRSRECETFLRHHDAQTQLPNREALLLYLGETLARMDANGVMALASFRLNSVRYANEKYGANVGDMLIGRFAEDLRQTLPPGTYCARLRSLTFAVVLGPVRSSIDLVLQAEQLRNSLPHQCEFDGNSLPIQLSTGIALIRAGETSPDAIMRRSETALDSARRSLGNPVALFDEIDEAQIRRTIEIEHGIMAALKNKEFRLVYQPKVDIDGKIAGLEALIRWRSPVLGPISPAEFIPIAETCGLIREITSFVIESVCSFICTTINRGYMCPPVALNLSAIDIVRHDLLDLIHASTNRYHTPPSLLEFEITETALIGNEALAIQHMQELQRRGHSIAIDDFGTGYSSLLKLSSFPVQSIKIDQSFVARIGTSAKSESIIKAIVALAEILSCTSVAEGVEIPEQEAFLASVGCKLFQGFFYHRPLEVAQLDAVLLRDAAMATLA